MNQTTDTAAPERLAQFYTRLAPIEPIIRIVLSEAEISCLLTFRGDPEKSVLLDFRSRPARIIVDPERGAMVTVTIPGHIMHDILCRRTQPGSALGRREMLLRGSAGDLARFIQLLEFGPVLYCEHLADIGFQGFERWTNHNTPEALMQGKIFAGDPIPLTRMNLFEKITARLVNGLSFAMGYAMGLLRYRVVKKLSLFDALTSMSRGLEAARPGKGTDPA